MKIYTMFLSHVLMVLTKEDAVIFNNSIPIDGDERTVNLNESSEEPSVDKNVRLLYVCSVVAPDETIRFSKLIRNIEENSVQSKSNVKLLLNVTSQDPTCANVYQRFSECVTNPVEKVIGRKIMIGPFCEISSSPKMFNEFAEEFFNIQSPHSSILFTTSFNFLTSNDDGFRSVISEKILSQGGREAEDRTIAMLIGNKEYYADAIWKLMADHFGWNRFVLIGIVGPEDAEERRGKFCKQVFRRIRAKANGNSFMLVDEYSWYLSPSKGEEIFEEIWSTVAHVTRVVLLCANFVNSGKFLKQLVNNNEEKNKYGVILMTTTIQDKNYFVDYLRELKIEEALQFVKLISYVVSLCNEYKTDKELEKLSLLDRHEAMTMEKIRAIYYCAILEYYKYLSAGNQGHKSFLSDYRKSDPRVAKEKKLIIWLPILSLETYDYDANQFGEGLRINWTVTDDKSPTPQIEIEANMKVIKWHKSDDRLNDSPYICKNRSTFYNCAPLPLHQSTFSKTNIFYIIGISATGLIVVVSCCAFGMLYLTWYNTKYLQRRYYLGAKHLKYKEECGTTHAGTYKKYKVIVVDKKVANLQKKTLESKEILREVSRIAHLTQRSSSFADLLGYMYSSPNEYKIVYKVGKGGSLTQVLRNIRLEDELKVLSFKK